ncbi:hypothetical protein QQP08_007286 [Theobroma cacao]|nr:hypothetical protein QQP08_007286 [Theobroma cacao]
MSVVRTQGSCVAIRSLSPSSSINRCSHGSATSALEFALSSDDSLTRDRGACCTDSDHFGSSAHVGGHLCPHVVGEEVPG